MSVYAVDKICWRTLHDLSFRQALKSNIHDALANEPITMTERVALENGDVCTLYRLGVSSFLMSYLCRYEIGGLTLATYNTQMRSMKVEETGTIVGPRYSEAVQESAG